MNAIPKAMATAPHSRWPNLMRQPALSPPRAAYSKTPWGHSEVVSQPGVSGPDPQPGRGVTQQSYLASLPRLSRQVGVDG